MTGRAGEDDGGRVRPALGAGLGVGLLLGVCGLVGLLVGEPLLFPSLAPTAMLVVESPRERGSAPSSVLLGHGVALGVGWGLLHLTGYADRPPVTEEGLTAGRVLLAVTALAVTTAVLRLLRVTHPPAGATVLLFALGVLSTPEDAAVVAAGVVLLTVVVVLAHRARGVAHPPWGRASGRRAPSPPSP